MHYYFAYGFRIESDIELPDIPASPGSPDVSIRRGTFGRTDRTSSDTEEYVTRGRAHFQILNGNEIRYSQAAGGDHQLLQVLLLGRIMALLLRQRGWFPLHGSAVEVGDSAVLFTAPSGSGKSTMAAALHARAHPLLTDDVAPVRVMNGTCLFRGGRRRLRLNPDSAETFRHLDPTAASHFDKIVFNVGDSGLHRYLPVRRIYELSFGDELRIEPMPLMEAATLLGRECFVRLHRAGPEVRASHLRACAEIASLGLVHRLIRPRNMNQLDAVAEFVEKDLQAAG